MCNFQVTAGMYRTRSDDGWSLAETGHLSKKYNCCLSTVSCFIFFTEIDTLALYLFKTIYWSWPGDELEDQKLQPGAWCFCFSVFQNVQTGSGDHLASCSVSIVWDVMLMTHLHLVLRLRKTEEHLHYPICLHGLYWDRSDKCWKGAVFG